MASCRGPGLHAPSTFWGYGLAAISLSVSICPKWGGVAQHLQVQQLGHIAVPVYRVLLLEGDSQGC